MEVEIILVCIVAGFVAQLIDGSLGMGYGVMLSMFLLSTGVPPIAVSASVHVAKIFAAITSGLSHLKLGNVDKDLTTRLVLFGMLGAIAGVAVLTRIPTEIIKPLVAVYLLAMGIYIVRKAMHKTEPKTVTTPVAPIGAAGGFCDAIGGGGWGAIVTPALLVRNQNPRFVIGSVSLAEFFVSAVIILLLWFHEPHSIANYVQMILGLIIGAVLAAPLAAYLCGKIAPRRLMIGVGVLVVALSTSTILSVVAENLF